MKRPAIQATCWGANRLDIFGLGTDNQMYHKAWDGNAWLPSPTGWEPLGGNFSGGYQSLPVAVSWGPNRLDIFCVGSNGSLYQKSWDGGKWLPSQSGWTPLGGLFGSSPAAVSWAPNRLDIFALGSDQSMYHKFWDGKFWFPSPTDWESFGGVFNSPPAAVSWGANRIDIFGLGTDNSMYHKFWAGNAWSGWEALGGVFNSPPAAVSWGPNRLDIFGLGTDNSMYHKAWNGSAWLPSPSDWAAIGGSFNSPPAAVSWGPNRLDVFALGAPEVFHKAFDNNAWGNWDPIGGVFNSSLSAVSWGPNRLDIFGLGTDNSMYHKAWSGSAWLPSLMNWESLGGVFQIPPPRGIYNTAPTVFRGMITSGGIAALGGFTQVLIYPDGTSRWSGSAQNSGIDAYDYGVTGWLTMAGGGRAIAWTHSGHVSPNSHNDWDIVNPAQPLIQSRYQDLSDGTFQSFTGYSSSIGSTIDSLLGDLAKWFVGNDVVMGFVIFVGVEVGSLITTGSLVPGARIVEGTLWLAGPANTLFALVAEGIASAGSQTRPLSVEEYNWASTEVFGGSLPEIGRLVLTDTIGPNNRPFTFPRFDGKITLNLGPDGFHDPRKCQVSIGRKSGEVFIHELVHAWQIAHTPLDLSLLADALSSKICEMTGGDPYRYGPAGPPYNTFNLEQQAMIVQDWWAGNKPAGTDQTGQPKDTSSPYYQYLVMNIPQGQA
jgi:Repeat of unknown function (DUF346)